MSKSKPKPVKRSVNSRPVDYAWPAGALRVLVTSRGLRAEDLAAATRRNAETARRWLSGRTVPTLPQGQVIADLLGVQMAELLEPETATASGTSSSGRAAKR